MGQCPEPGGNVAGVILAGGRSQRMGGGDKALLPFAGRPMIAHVIERLRPQTAALMINTGSASGEFAQFGVTLAADVYGDYAGPLAGVLTGMRWAREHYPAARWIVTAACDTPFIPLDYTGTLREAAACAGASIAIAASGGRPHFVLGLWSVALAEGLAAHLADGERKVQLWVERHTHVIVPFPEGPAGDPFYNVNTPEDFAAAERILGGEAT